MDTHSMIEPRNTCKKTFQSLIWHSLQQGIEIFLFVSPFYKLLVLGQRFALRSPSSTPPGPSFQEIRLGHSICTAWDVPLCGVGVEPPPAVWALYEAGVWRAGDRRRERLPSSHGHLDLLHVLHGGAQGLGLETGRDGWVRKAWNESNRRANRAGW